MSFGLRDWARQLGSWIDRLSGELIAQLTDRWAPLLRDAEAFAAQLVKIVAHYAFVETRVDGRLLGRTKLGWTGDVETTWHSGIDAEQVGLHQRALALAIASRDRLLRLFAAASQCAAALVVAGAAPPAMLLALPAAWRFVNLVIVEYAS